MKFWGGGGAEAECMKCDQISNTFTVVAICTFASDFSGTSDSKWDEVRHVFFRPPPRLAGVARLPALKETAANEENA